MNPRITKKEKGLIKGALRRIFSRSELRSQIIENSIYKGTVKSKRSKVKTWCKCASCGKLEAKSYMVVDHISPVIEVHESLATISLDTLADRIWCDSSNLQALDKKCHDVKTARENLLRKTLKYVKLSEKKKRK